MISWMLYALLVSACIGIAGAALGAIAGSLRLPTRWIWLAMLLATAAFTLFPLEERGVGPMPVTPVVISEGAPVGGAAAVERSAVPGLLEVVRRATMLPLRPFAELRGRGLDASLLTLWILGSAVVLGIGAATLHRYRRERRRWPLGWMAGRSVRVAPAAGPAVMGVVRSEIVVPRWLFGASEAEQRLVVTHEAEHVRARDPLLLGVGGLCAALVPWNPLSWWMLYRLRLAVEVDCDARVLARGADVRGYGGMLIEMAGRGAGLPLRAAALAASSSTLERRLKAMSEKRRGGIAKVGALGLLAALALVAACEARVPTAAEVDAMDVGAVERRAAVFAVGDDMENAVYYVDGRQVTAEEARALVADRIARVEVMRQGDAPATIRISTSEAGEGEGDGTALRLRTDRVDGERVIRFRQHGEPAEGEGQVLRLRAGNETATEAAILFIDGVRMDPARLRTLRPDQIEKIEIIKGEAAVEMFGDPEAVKGVIRVTTKAGTPQP